MSNITQSHQHPSQTTVMKLVTIFIDDKKSELSPFYKHINSEKEKLFLLFKTQK